MTALTYINGGNVSLMFDILESKLSVNTVYCTQLNFRKLLKKHMKC